MKEKLVPQSYLTAPHFDWQKMTEKRNPCFIWAWTENIFLSAFGMIWLVFWARGLFSAPVTEQMSVWNAIEPSGGKERTQQVERLQGVPCAVLNATGDGKAVKPLMIIRLVSTCALLKAVGRVSFYRERYLEKVCSVSCYLLNSMN